MADPHRHITQAAGICRLLLLAALFTVLPAGCGTKGSLTLKSWEPPPSPINITAVHREDSITLLWAVPPERQELLSGFIVRREASAGPPREFLVPAGERSFVDRDFLPGETYRYQVRATNNRGILSAGTAGLPVAPRETPPPPQSPVGVVRGNSVVLTWEGSAGHVFNVYRRSGDQPYGMSPLNAAPLRSPSFTDGLNMQTAVRYAVRASLGTDIRDEGPLSKEVVIDPSELAPPSPRNLSWHAVADRIVLTWDDPEESWVSGYRIYRRARGQGYVLAGETQLPSFVDTDTSTGLRDYRITAVGPLKEGPPAELTGIGLPPPDPQ